MDNPEPEEARVFWVPELGKSPIDLTQELADHGPIAMTPQPIPLDTEGAEIEYFDPIASIPEGTLTEVVLLDEDGAGTVGHAEVVHDEDGTRTLKIYGINYNPEVTE